MKQAKLELVLQLERAPFPSVDTHEAEAEAGAECQANDIPLTDELTALKLLLLEH